MQTAPTGPPDRFRDLLTEHQSMVFSIAARILSNRSDAEEVAQDVFLALHAALPQLDAPEHVLRWLRRVTVHRSLDALRRKRLRPDSHAELWLDQIDACGSRPETAEYARDLSQRLDALLCTLPASMRAAVVLRYQEDLSPPEIAATLAQPLATVKSNLQRALRLLRRKAPQVLKEYARG